ncbi:hypothetical protein KJ780_01175 [Candidatus Micrarchaeota archaeon]|nr:hypothetical protein [Candidatus Micrarchaeota archaeon]
MITLILFAVLAALVLGIKGIGKGVEESDAKKFVTEDLSARFPDADKITIISTNLMQNEEGEDYFKMKASVSYGLSGICPTRTYYYYNYPVQNFVPAPAEEIVKDCEVCASQPCIIAFEEEAIIGSHTFDGTEEVNDYIMDAFTSSRYGDEPVPTVNKIPQGWEVVWKSNKYNYSYSVIMSSDGSVVEVKQN